MSDLGKEDGGFGADICPAKPRPASNRAGGVATLAGSIAAPDDAPGIGELFLAGPTGTPKLSYSRF